MARVEVDDRGFLVAHAENEGNRETALEGCLGFDSSDDGMAAVLSLTSVGEKGPMTDALRDLVMRSMRSRNLVVVHDGDEVVPEIDENRVLRRVGRLSRLPQVKRIPRGGPARAGEL
jgi:hypothetical protein